MSLFINAYAEESCVLRTKEKENLIKSQFQNHVMKHFIKQDLRQVSLHVIFINQTLWKKLHLNFFTDAIIRRNEKLKMIDHFKLLNNNAWKYTFAHI